MTKKEVEEIIFNVECDLTTLVLAVLKFTEVIDWAWFWVLSPIWVLAITKILASKQK